MSSQNRFIEPEQHLQLNGLKSPFSVYNTLLMMYAHDGRYQDIMQLSKVRGKGYIQRKNMFDQTAMDIAINRGKDCLETVKVLVDVGALPYKEGEAPTIDVPSTEFGIKVAEYLMQYGVNVTMDGFDVTERIKKVVELDRGNEDLEEKINGLIDENRELGKKNSLLNEYKGLNDDYAEIRGHCSILLEDYIVKLKGQAGYNKSLVKELEVRNMELKKDNNDLRSTMSLSRGLPEKLQ